ncbi:MAG: hypothetical protein AB7F59_15575 [Bdellovibrionales bacterium]
MKMVFILSFLFALSAQANNIVCKVEVQEESEFIKGSIIFSPLANGKYKGMAKWELPESGEVELGVGSKMDGTNDSELKEACPWVENQTETLFCNKVKTITVISTPDESGDSNDSGIVEYKDVRGVTLGSLGKIGWFLAACSPPPL